MKNQDIQKLRDKEVKVLEKEAQKLRMELARLQLDMKMNPPKDSNLVAKKKKELAVTLTIITEKRLQSEQAVQTK